jgi:hypothetical protein
MHVEDVLRLDRKRERGQEGAMARAELPTGPVDGGECAPPEGVVRPAQCRGVVVAHHDDGAARSVLLDQVEYRDRIGAIADQIAQERTLVSPQGVRVREARGDRFEIAVDVGEESYLQTALVFWMR